MASTGGQRGLRFGIYPWGAVGATVQIAPFVPEDPDRSLAAATALRGDRSFTVQAYTGYTGTDGTASADRLMSEVTWWSAHGFRIAAVLRYQPAARAHAAGYTAWATALAARLAEVPGVSGIQVANEPTNPAPDAGDGSYPGVLEAIARTVPAVRATLVEAGREDVAVGFNHAAGDGPGDWRGLARAGGRPLAAAVGFVALNIYPGTWPPPAGRTAPAPDAVESAFARAFADLREGPMRAAGLPRDVPIHVAETGWPTSAARSEAEQDAAAGHLVAAVTRLAAAHHVTDLRWFALRDGNTASGELENGYGLLRDDYTPKPAFETFRSAVATAGV